MSKKLLKSIKLFSIFFFIGLFTIGGGYAMIPLMREHIVKREKYISEEEFLDVFAISQITPGPIAINMATYIGFKQAGIMGSSSATLGVVLPSFLVILLISFFFVNLTQISFVQKLFIGILTGVVGQIAYLTFDLFKKQKYTLLFWAILIISLIEIFVLKISPVYVILIGGIIGVIFAKDNNNANVS